MQAAPDEAATLAALHQHRPDLVEPYRAALPGARAAVLARLWGALGREPIDGIARRDDTRIMLTDGRAVALDDIPDRHPARLVEALRLAGPGAARFAVEVDNSVANLALARAAAMPATGHDLVDAEQSIVDGHPLHPCCRTRIGMSTLDVLAYAPEHRPTVDLAVVEVDPGRWHTAGAPRPPRLPVHPWQLPRALATGLVRDTGDRIPARPLMSLRTLAPVGGGAHLKTAVEVQMTSAVRTLSAATVDGGPPMSALVAAVADRVPGLTVLRETSAAAVLVDGVPDRRLAALWREAPRLGPGETVLPLAACRAATDGAFAALVDTLLPPLLAMLRLGVALEAHGQNTLVVYRDGRPYRLLYRDVGGILLSPRRLAAAGVDPPVLAGRFVTDDPDTLRTTLYSAVLATVVAGLAGSRRQRWDLVASTLSRAEAVAVDDRRALRAATLPLKAMTAMRLAPNPLDPIWTSIPNPLRA